ncbi:MAG: hypothetical protein KBG67_00620 [Candidatus Atribacteria bacterium]|nr:hypothetical protein [Candidatus Atribacteria bacterium]
MDLFGITKSKLRKELLLLYFTNPNKKYYLRELERILNFSVGNIRRELIRLEQTGFFCCKNEGNFVYYYLNQNHPLFKELRNITFKTYGFPRMLQNVLKKFSSINQAFIYGSFTQEGEGWEDSEINLLIIGKVEEDRLNKEIERLERKSQREINYAIYEKEDFEREKEEGNPFILNILKEKKVFLIGEENRSIYF